MPEIDNPWLITGIVFLLVVGFLVGMLLFNKDCETCEEPLDIDCDADELWDDDEEECVAVECPPLYVFDKNRAKCIPT